MRLGRGGKKKKRKGERPVKRHGEKKKEGRRPVAL